MNGEDRAKLVEMLARTFSLEQLDKVVKRALGKPLQYYSTASDLPTVADKLLSDLELTNDQLDFLLKLREWFNRPQVRGAVDAYLGLPDSSLETYDALIVFEEPFVDRQLFRTKLQDLFLNTNRRALVSRGQRACGKSHSRWEGIESVYVDLQETTLDEIVSQLINEMSLPPKDFRDRLAQFTTMSKGFVTALRGSTRNVLAGQRWCLIFDSYDSEKVDKDRRDFVDVLLADIANLQMPPIWMIVLGHRPWSAGTPGSTALKIKVIADDIQPMTPPDVEKFLKDLAARSGQALTDNQAATMASEVFGTLVPPLGLDGMMAMSDRLREKISIFTGGF